MKSILYYYSKFVQKYLRGKYISNSKVDSTACVNSGSTVYNSSISKYSYLGYNCEIVNTEIGAYCSLSSGVYIGLTDHPLSWVSTSPVFQNINNSSVKRRFAKIDLPEGKHTIIGNDVWIGTNAIVKAGVCIGTGAVVAAGAVVTKDVAPYSIVGGCPARLIRYRFDSSLNEALLKSEWWNLSDSDLELIGKNADDPLEFLKAVNGLTGGGINT